jgi:hypothetical protein
MVNQLIIEDHLRDMVKVRSIFLAPDADAILQTPLRVRAGDDRLAWVKENSRSTRFG